MLVTNMGTPEVGSGMWEGRVMWEWGTHTHTYIHICTHTHMHTHRHTHAHTHTIGTGGMCKYDDVINGPVVVLGRWRILEYRGHL